MWLHCYFLSINSKVYEYFFHHWDKVITVTPHSCINLTFIAVLITYYNLQVQLISDVCLLN